MKQSRNPEVLKELIIGIVITLAAAVGCLFVEPWCALIVLACGGLLVVIHYVFLKRRYNRIAELSRSIDSILHGQEGIQITGSEEGELSILNSEIHKMLTRLREQTAQLSDDKVRLTAAIEDIFHQLRTPLTSMNLIVTMLSEEEMDEARRLQLTRQMKRQLERMQWLIETLLKMSKISSGTATFRSERVLMKNVIHDATQPFLIPMELRGQELQITYADASNADSSKLDLSTASHIRQESQLTSMADSHSTHHEQTDPVATSHKAGSVAASDSISFIGDASWTVEALANLIKNCMEHTPEGGRISIACEETAISTNITITDTGEGFNTADIPYLFERFYKGSNSSAESIGIGLALSRLIITEQNGTITADNAPEGGARFQIKFYKSIV